MSLRFGLGFDSHRLEMGSGLVLGGLVVPVPFRFIAHSDGDVLLHATIDALLGAVAGPDIGDLFPPSDPAYKDIASGLLLQEVLEKHFWLKGYQLEQITLLLVAQIPELKSYKAAITENLCKLLKCDFVRLQISEDFALGAFGRQEGVAALVTCSVECS